MKRQVISGPGIETRTGDAEIDPPLGLKKLSLDKNFTYKFTYTALVGGGNGEGVFNQTSKVWLFLEEKPDGSSLILAVESGFTLNAGRLLANDTKSRGWGNMQLTSGLQPPSGFDPLAQQPTGGSGKFQGTASVPISYRDPLGGFRTWTYEHQIDDVVEGWSVISATAGPRQGSKWFFHNPFDGNNPINSWLTGFNGLSSVKDLTAASVGTLSVHDVSVWRGPNTPSPFIVSVKPLFTGVRLWINLIPTHFFADESNAQEILVDPSQLR